MPEKNSQAGSSNKLRIISNVLTKAVKLWLKSQVSQVSQLELDMKASDRQILSGSIPLVSIFASNAIYQGLHITRIQLLAENIQVNIRSILKGQPLTLLEPIPVLGELVMQENDLNSSLSSALLSTGLNELLVQLLPEHWPKSGLITWQNITLDNHKVILRATLASANESIPVEIFFQLSLLSKRELQLANIQIKQNDVALLEENYTYTVDLGSDVEIQELTLTSEELFCRGLIKVNP